MLELETAIEMLRTLGRCELVRTIDALPGDTPQECRVALFQRAMEQAAGDAGAVLVAFLARRGRAYTITLEAVWRTQDDGSALACVVLTAVDAEPPGPFAEAVLDEIAATVTRQMREEEVSCRPPT